MTDAAAHDLAHPPRCAPFDAGAHVVAAGFLGEAPALALADGALLIGEPEAQKRVVAHPGRGDPARGHRRQDAADRRRRRPGRRRSAADGASREIADEKGRWIDALALRGGNFAWSAGKTVSARDEAGVVKTWSAPSTRARPRLPAEGLSPGGRPLQRRVALVSQGRGRAADARMEGRASRRDLLAGRALPRHLDAGERAARLAARRFAQHAHDRLSRQDALAVVVA